LSRAQQLAEHFFRHEYSRLVATLSRRVGVQHIEAVEDAVQTALMSALASWTVAGVPANPSAWLFHVANNNLLGDLRQGSRRRRLVEQNPIDGIPAPELVPEPYLSGEVQDDLLRMLFVCCDEAIPVESQLVLALKVLCGFEVREIAERLFTSDANVYKRLNRARDRLRTLPLTFTELSYQEYSSRLPAVHKILYLLFTEGYLSSHAKTAIRRELCTEAMRLATILADHSVGDAPETAALLALMHLHLARLSAREDESGGLLLLEEQDRGRWDQQEIAVGLSWLAKSAAGDLFSRYHAEAAIAAEHCLAPSFQETRWDKVVENYLWLEQLEPSPLYRLNRAVAVAELQGPAAGLDVLEGFEPPTWIAGSYMWAAVLADLHRRCGDLVSAQRYRIVACNLAPSPALKDVLERRLDLGDLL
jgi:RNA polymerase sigma factor (sigma-70 family)